MNTRKIIIAVTAAGILGLLALGWYLGAPLFINRTVEEAFPTGRSQAAELGETPEESQAEATAENPASISPEQPVLLLQGQFRDADEFHQGSGTAGIYRLPDGSHVLRLESFMVTNGPDLHVLLASGPSPTDAADLGEMLDLGKLKGNLGEQNYEIPEGVDLDSFHSVVIYCQPFHVVFSVASIQP